MFGRRLRMGSHLECGYRLNKLREAAAILSRNAYFCEHVMDRPYNWRRISRGNVSHTQFVLSRQLAYVYQMSRRPRCSIFANETISDTIDNSR
jgi:hypothetical protein